jgi:hypothetical protein
MIEDWHKQILKLWSMRVALFWLVIAGLIMVWPGLAGSMSPVAYGGIGVLMVVSFGTARLLKQPGTDQ